MKVLSLWPPQVPSYFNAGHHLPVFLTAAYLRAQGHEVVSIDAGALNIDWKRFADLVYQGQFDVVSIVNDFDNIEDFDRTVRYLRTLSPATKVITTGRLSVQAPHVFESTDVDAFIISGDPEAGVGAYLDWLAAGEPAAKLPAGSVVRVDGDWRRSPVPGVMLPAEQWRLPDVSEIPYAAYTRMYSRDESKFCGIPQRQELVVPAARGCPVGCAFCDVPGVQGLRDRRISVERTIDYIQQSFQAQPFEYVAFYAPTFTLDRRWTRQLCDALIELGSPYPWKCATTVSHLPPDLLTAMGRAGCVRVSVGLESLEADGQSGLPAQKRIDLERFHELARSCASLGIELNCFAIAGLPGTTAAGVARTVAEIRAVGGRVRPTMYGNIDELRKARTLAEAMLFNRQLLHPLDSGPEDSELYDLVFGVEPHPTEIMNAIPQRAG
jgi:hypothetical protein